MRWICDDRYMYLLLYLILTIISGMDVTKVKLFPKTGDHPHHHHYYCSHYPNHHHHSYHSVIMIIICLPSTLSLFIISLSSPV